MRRCSAAASIAPDKLTAASVADFLALGYAHLQVELITRALRYTSVLDTEQFASAVVAAADAAVAGNREVEHEELGRAFDLLSDARNHVYSVDFYVVDVTLLADSTLANRCGKNSRLSSPTNLLVTGEQIEQIAREHSGHAHRVKACTRSRDRVHRRRHVPWRLVYDSIAGGALQASSRQDASAARQHLDRDYEVFGQFEIRVLAAVAGGAEKRWDFAVRCTPRSMAAGCPEPINVKPIGEPAKERRSKR